MRRSLDGTPFSMPREASVSALSTVQRELRALLSSEGFRPQGRTYRRTTKDSLVHVINLQAGRPAPPSKAVTGLVRTDLGGKFTVNLGVHLPGVAVLKGQRPSTRGPQEFDCQIRARLGELLVPPSDRWWPLDGDIRLVATEVGDALRDAGFPFLDRYRTREDVITHWVADAGSLHLANDARVIVGLQLYELGRKADAAKELQLQYAGSDTHPQHQAWLLELAEPLGLDIRASAV
jgi:Domain of unknown function (DUF4304)